MVSGEIIFIKREDWEKIKGHKLFKQDKLKRIEAEYLTNLINIDDLGYSEDTFPPLLTLYTDVFVNLVNKEYMFSSENDVVNKSDINFSDFEISGDAIPPDQRTLFADRTDAWHMPVFKNLREKYTKAKEIPGFVNPYTQIEAQEEKENILHQVKEEEFKLIAIEKN